ncbi:hypothetical protein [Tatumella terrea]|uniref:Uncharacterized protein n=1 Tax=Tatumella terrea TaxID=419007 RepID=A0ABW1VWE4_9GAMM
MGGIASGSCLAHRFGGIAGGLTVCVRGWLFGCFSARVTDCLYPWLTIWLFACPCD